MKIDIRRYISLRDSLAQEKAGLEERLREINEALGEGAGTAEVASSSARRGATTPVRTRGPGRRRATGGGLSLREAVLQVTSRGSLTKEQILEGVKGLGYRFSTNNPLNSLGVILYGKKPKFKNDGGRFSPLGGSGFGSAGGSKGGGATNGRSNSKRKRRKLSPEARERIAAAQRARWAKAKGK